MSTYVEIYTEVKISGRDNWICIDPKGPFVNKDGEIKYRFCTTYESYGGHFGLAYDKICAISCETDLDSVSDTVRNIYINTKDFSSTTSEPLFRPFFVLYFNNLKEILPPEGVKSCYGFVTKEERFDFMYEDLQSIEPISPLEYNALPDGIKQSYVWFEWDEPDGWVSVLRHVKERVDHRLEDFKSHNYCSDIDNVRLIWTFM